MENTPAYLDESLSFEERARDLVSRMTLEEKVTQMMHNSPAIPRLGIPHTTGGMKRSMAWPGQRSHRFPQAIGIAATFDETGL